LTSKIRGNIGRGVSIYVVLWNVHRAIGRVKSAGWLIVHWWTSNLGVSRIQRTLLRNALRKGRRSRVKQRRGWWMRTWLVQTRRIRMSLWFDNMGWSASG
jgi:hypothetical protein